MSLKFLHVSLADAVKKCVKTSESLSQLKNVVQKLFSSNSSNYSYLIYLGVTEPRKEDPEQEGERRKEGQLVVALLKAVAKLSHNASVQQAEKVVLTLLWHLLPKKLSKKHLLFTQD